MMIDIFLPSKQLANLVHFFEATDGLAVVKTIDGKKAHAQLIFPNDQEQEMLELLEKIKKYYLMEAISITPECQDMVQ